MKQLAVNLFFYLITFFISVAQSESNLIINRIEDVDLIVQSAEITKILADEHFLLGSTNNNKHHYNKAKINYALVVKLLKGLSEAKIDEAISPVLSDYRLKKSLFIEFLVKDSMYRLELLNSNLSFYGYEIDLVPQNPTTVYAKYKSALQSLENTYSEIEGLFEKIKDTQLAYSELELQTDEAAYKQRINEIESKSIRNQNDFGDRNLKVISAKMSAYIENQKKLDKELKQNLSELDNAYDSFNNAMTDGLMVAAGVPSEFKGIINGEAKISDILEDAAKNYITDQIQSEFDEGIKELTETYSEAYKVYQSAEDIKNKYEDFKTTSDNIRRIISKPSAKNLMLLGEKIADNLESSVISELKSQVKESSSYKTLISLSNQGSEIRNVLSSKVIREYNRKWKKLNDKLIKVIKESSGDIETTYLGITKQYKDLNTYNFTEKELKAVVNLIYKVQKKEFSELFNNTTKDFLINQSSNTNLFNIDDQGKISVNNYPGNIKLEKIIQLPSQHKLLIYDEKENEGFEQLKIQLNEEKKKIKTEILRFIRKLDIKNSQKKIQSRVIASLSDEALEDLLKSIGLNNKTTKAKVFKTTLNSIQSSEQSKFYTQAVNFSLGGKVMKSSKSIIKYKDTIFKRNAFEKENSSIKSNSQLNSKQAQQLLTNALLGGYSSAYNSAKKIIEANNKIDELLEKHNDFDKRSKKLTSLIIQLESQQSEALRNIGLAKAKFEVAEVLHKALKIRDQRLSTILADRVETTTDTRAKITNKLPLLYFDLELLRKHFYHLNNTHQLWFGISFNDLVISNPSNLRYALDNDILLFDWLNNEIDSERANLSKLVSKWRKVDRIIEENCKSCHVGESLQNVSQTNPIRLSELVYEEDWKKFKNWQKEQSSVPHKIVFTLPTRIGGISERNTSNVRIVDLSIGGAIYKGNETLKSVPFNGSYSRLSHPGYATIKKGNKYQTDILESKSYSSLNFNSLPNNKKYNIGNYPPSFNLYQLSSRWNSDVDRPIRNYEGYSPFTLWTLEFDPTRETKKIDDIFLRIAYQYNENISQNQFKDYNIIVETKEGNQIKLNGSNLNSFNINGIQDIEFLANKYKELSENFNNIFAKIQIITGNDEPFTIEQKPITIH